MRTKWISQSSDGTHPISSATFTIFSSTEIAKMISIYQRIFYPILLTEVVLWSASSNLTSARRHSSVPRDRSREKPNEKTLDIDFERDQRRHLHVERGICPLGIVRCVTDNPCQMTRWDIGGRVFNKGIFTVFNQKNCYQKWRNWLIIYFISLSRELIVSLRSRKEQMFGKNVT